MRNGDAGGESEFALGTLDAERCMMTITITWGGQPRTEPPDPSDDHYRRRLPHMPRYFRSRRRKQQQIRGKLDRIAKRRSKTSQVSLCQSPDPERRLPVS